MGKHWERLDSRTVIEDRWLSVRADTCRSVDGRLIDPYYVIEDLDWVHAVAIDAEHRILVVRQYRHGAGVVCLELPGGTLDRGEDPLSGAQREMQEETGYIARQWEPLVAPWANPARQTNRVHFFLARDVADSGRRDLDENEDIEVEWISIPELKRRIDRDEFAQSMHIAGVLFALEWLKSEE